MTGGDSSRKAAYWITAVAVTGASVVLVAAGPEVFDTVKGVEGTLVRERIASLWRDDGDAQAALVRFADRIQADWKESDVFNHAAPFPQLSVVQMGEGRIMVTTPRRAFADNWVAWFRFGVDGSLLGVAFGTADYVGPHDRPPGLPRDRCYAPAAQCTAAYIAGG